MCFYEFSKKHFVKIIIFVQDCSSSRAQVLRVGTSQSGTGTGTVGGFLLCNVLYMEFDTYLHYLC